MPLTNPDDDGWRTVVTWSDAPNEHHVCGNWQTPWVRIYINGEAIGPRRCGWCDHTEPCEHKNLLVRLIKANGVEVVAEVCGLCGKKRGERKKVEVSAALAANGRDISDLPRAEMEHTRRSNRSCARCGNPFVELHHWAPRHLFDDADNWPASYLCRDCHTEWHRVTRTGSYRQQTA